MSWELVFNAHTNRSGELLEIDEVFTSTELIVETEIYRRRFSNRSVGHLLPRFQVSNIGFVEGKRAYIKNATQKVILQNTETPYLLSFYLAIWVLEIDITIWQNKGSEDIKTQLQRIEEKIDTNY